jgi:hypothetical protein
MFSITNGLIQVNALSPLLYKLAVEYATARVQVTQDILKFNGTHPILVYADVVNILDGSVHTIKKNVEALVFAIEENGLEVNADKSTYMVRSGDQDAGRSHSVKIDYNSFERVEEFKFWNNLNKSKFYSGRNEEQITVRECLLSSGAEAFVFQFAVQKYKN